MDGIVYPVKYLETSFREGGPILRPDSHPAMEVTENQEEAKPHALIGQISRLVFSIKTSSANARGSDCPL